MGPRARDTARDLVLASHPGPGVAVTALAVLLAASLGASTTTLAVLGCATLAGQLTVGWLNDLLDAERDRRAGRRDKPVADGRLTATTVRTAIRAALAVAVVASLSLGAAPGLLHLALVAVGWSYDLRLKATWWSWLPYAVCFGLLPSVVALAVGAAPAPWWMLAAGLTLGVGAHLVNAVPDLDADRRSGVVGLPHRLGARRSLDVATGLLVCGAVATVAGPPGPVGVLGWTTLAAVLALAVAGRLAGGRTAFVAAVGISLACAAALVVRA